MAHCEAKAKSEETESEIATVVASDEEDEVVRVNNAYPGAINDAGAVHQRRWYLSIDREASGFVKTAKQSKSGFLETSWSRNIDERLANGYVGKPSGFERFIVGGRDVERSVVTGMLPSDILPVSAGRGLMSCHPGTRMRNISSSSRPTCSVFCLFETCEGVPIGLFASCQCPMRAGL